MTRWRITRRCTRWMDDTPPPPDTLEVEGDTLHVTASGDLFILGPNPRLEVIHTWAHGRWDEAEKLTEPRVPVLERPTVVDPAKYIERCTCIRMSDCNQIFQIDRHCPVHGVV